MRARPCRTTKMKARAVCVAWRDTSVTRTDVSTLCRPHRHRTQAPAARGPRRVMFLDWNHQHTWSTLAPVVRAPRRRPTLQVC